MTESAPVNWRELEPSPELDRIIALHLGLEPFPKVKYADGRWMDCFIQPDSAELPIEVKYSRDTCDAFVILLSEPYIEWNIFTEPDDWITCELGHWSDDWHNDQLVHATEHTVAHAITKALLFWWEREDHPAPQLKEG